MNMSDISDTPQARLNDYSLEERYTRKPGRVFLTGTQALVRILLDQRDRDITDGINSAGFVSGYRGSPLGGVDLELWRAQKFLKEKHIEFLHAVNEDLAATAVLGSQQVESHPQREVEGVFGLWYGKGPGVDRSGDALKHGNAYGSSPHGGVLVVAGDDHGCVSSSMPHQSDVAFMAWFMPTLNPASVAEYLSFGEYGYALSRFSGMWAGFKAISETVESCASVDLPARRRFVRPDTNMPPGGLHYRWPDLPGPQIEQRLEHKKNAVLAFAAANPIDRKIYDIADATYGIVTTGKGHLDLMEALRLLGLTETECRRLGIDIYKVGMVWPLAHHDALEFVREKREILVIEEKRGIIESQFKEYFYDYPGRNNVFQNLGEGTYYHSGSMAIRQAVAARTNITYKILFNDAVAMTGGQPVDGPISVHGIAHEVRANGVARIALVSDHPEQFNARDFPAGATFHPRENLDAVQRELREIPGVSVLIYEQECATEKRRRRKRGQLADPPKFASINDLVCEGCGDCSVESNCLSVEPKETPFGRKRQINLSSCNKDFSCLNGFCPSFVTVEGATRRKKQGSDIDVLARADALPEPRYVEITRPYNLLVTGVGGTGVITVGALVTMAAHLEGKGASVLDFTGFAQKFGPVMSFIRLSTNPGDINQVRIDQGSADGLIGCDIVVSSSSKATATYRREMRAVINMAEMPTGDIVRNPDASLAGPMRLQSITRLIGPTNIRSFDANRISDALFGDTVFANVIMLGAGWQQGLVPVSMEALMRAIELNVVAVDQNKQAFACGRLAVAAENFVASLLGQAQPEETLDHSIERRTDFLTSYQDTRNAKRYRTIVNVVRTADPDQA